MGMRDTGPLDHALGEQLERRLLRANDAEREAHERSKLLERHADVHRDERARVLIEVLALWLVTLIRARRVVFDRTAAPWRPW